MNIRDEAVEADLELAEIKSKLSALTPGQWKAYNRGIGYEIHSEHDEPINVGVRETFTKEDAEFIASAPPMVARLTAALEAALTFHKPIESAHPQVLGPVCEGCSDVDELNYTFYPCETVEAVKNALKESK